MSVYIHIYIYISLLLTKCHGSVLAWISEPPEYKRVEKRARYQRPTELQMDPSLIHSERMGQYPSFRRNWLACWLLMPGSQGRIPLSMDIFLPLSKRSESLRGYCSAIIMLFRIQLKLYGRRGSGRRGPNGTDGRLLNYIS